MEIISLSNSERCRVAEELLSSYEFKNIKNYIKRIILLPVPSFRDGEHITGGDMTLEEVMSMLAYGDLVVGYGFSCYFCERAEDCGALFLDLKNDREYIFKNNELTSHATLARILSIHGRDISDIRVGIIGYGGLGQALLRELLFLGCRATVFSGSENKREALQACGVSALDYSHAASEKCDILINTAPTTLPLYEDTAPLLIDLASGNRYSGIGAVFLPSLPEKAYPQSSGKIYAKAVIDHCGLH